MPGKVLSARNTNISKTQFLNSAIVGWADRHVNSLQWLEMNPVPTGMNTTHNQKQ